MLYVSAVLLIFAGIIFPRSKIVFSLICIFFIVTLGWAYGSHDVMIHINRYQEYDAKFFDFTEPLYTAIIAFSNTIGLNYRQYFIIIAIVEILFLGGFIKRSTKNFSLVAALYILFPMVINFYQMRYFLAFSVFLAFGSQFVFRLPQYKYRLFLAAGITVSLFIHIGMSFMFILLLLPELSIRKTIMIVLIIMAVSGIIMHSFAEIIGFYFDKIAIGKTFEQFLTAAQYAVEGNVGRLKVSLIQLLGGSFFCYVYYRRSHRNLQASSQDRYVSEMLLKCNICAYLSIPLIWYVSFTFARLAAFFFLFSELALARTVTINKLKLSKADAILIVSGILVVIAVALATFHDKNYRELTLIPMFEQNALFTDNF